MKIEIRNRCSDFNSYRAARVKSLFNAESGCNFDLDAELRAFGRAVDRRGGWSLGGTVDGELTVHLAVSSMNKGKSVEARACPLVTMPEWQGAGVGFRFLNEICAMQERGDEFAGLAGRKTTTLFYTSHPQLCQTLRRDKCWRQLSGNMVGNNKTRSSNSTRRSQAKRGAEQIGGGGDYGGHFRAVQGFRSYGKVGLEA